MASKSGESDRRATKPAKPRLSPSRLNLDASGLPGASGKLFRKFTGGIFDYARSQDVSDTNFERILSEALHHTLPQAGRQPTLTGREYAVLALNLYLPPIIDTLERWDEEPAIQVVEALQARWDQMRREDRFNLNLRDVCEWLHVHALDDDRGEAVASCIRLDAPEEVQIERRLAQAGAQKRVFAANWTIADDPTEIVVKEFLGEAEQILIRERRPHPLSMTHPNIIETFMLENQATPAKTFLVERRLEVMDDSKRLAGWSECGRLLIDIARALAFLADQGLVHGDVKPDNIGRRDGRFVLLDFGICRPASEFMGEVAQTGSLRTRAPEVLEDLQHHSEQSDVWALGATLFNVLFERFPLLNKDEKPPHAVNEKAARERFEEELRRRIREDWADRLAPLRSLQHEGMRSILEAMLEPAPTSRPDAAEVLRWGLRDLTALVGVQEGPRFAPRNELDALKRHLASDQEQISLLPDRYREALDMRLTALDRALRANRHYQRAAERVATVAEIELNDPLHQKDANQRARLERLVQLARNFRTPEDQRDMELLESVREQLRLAEPPEHTHQPTLIEALSEAIDDAKKGSHEEALEAAGQELQRLLPASHA